MHVRAFLTALVLASAPGLATAQACNHGMFGHDARQATMSCAEGTAWDAASQSCLPIVSS